MAEAQARTLRAEILGALTRPTGGTTVSMTPKYLASQINAPVRAVREELTALSLERITKSRTHRSGEVLYSLRDQHDDAWDAFRTPAPSLN